LVSLQNYAGREQAYVKHVFLERYLEGLVHKTASRFPHISYVDGFAGPWQSTNEKFEDTSFGIALNALRRAKASWKSLGRDVQVSAFLVERDTAAYQRLAEVPKKYPDIKIKTYPANFTTVIPAILKDLPSDAFTFFFVDPKGWRIQLQALEPMLARRNSETVFNFMFDFINRAASIRDQAISTGLDELIPHGNWRAKLESIEAAGTATSDDRKAALVEGFSQSLARLGNYSYVAETTVLRPRKERPLYCLFYATRHPKGIEVFRDSQIKALIEQSTIRATRKLEDTEIKTGQGEFFESVHEMAQNELTAFLEQQRHDALASLLALTPKAPDSIRYEDLWPQILARHIVKRSDVNKIAANLRRQGALIFPEWESRKQVPQSNYRTQRP